MDSHRRTLLAGLAAAGFMAPLRGLAQQLAKTPVIGLLWTDSEKPSPFAEILLRGLHDSGWVVGQNLRVEDRVTLDGYGDLTQGAADLVRMRVDLIVCNGSTATLSASRATKEIPIVTLTGQDPVKLGVAKSLSRPGGNVTGIATRTADLTAKRMELMKELVPDLSRLGVVLAKNVGNPNFIRESEAAAKRLNLHVQFVEVDTAEEIEERLAELARSRVNAIAVAPSTLLSSHSARMVTAVGKHRIPAVYGNERYADAGGLVTYSTSINKSIARMTRYVDRILRGASAGELPIEQVSDLELIVNLKAAKILGIKVPQSMLLRADRVIQ